MYAGVRQRFWRCSPFCVAYPALAHHSFTMFDMTKRITVSGTVTSFEWTNPHAYIEIDAVDEAGAVALEHRIGQPQHPATGRLEILEPKEGRQDHAHHQSAKNPGQAGGFLFQATLPDGRALTNGPARAQQGPLGRQTVMQSILKSRTLCGMALAALVHCDPARAYTRSPLIPISPVSGARSVAPRW